MAGAPFGGQSFYDVLKDYLPTISLNGQAPVIHLRDATFNKIAQLCLDYGKPQWAQRPRHFSILYMIGHPELMDLIAQDGRSDILLPYADDTIPYALTGRIKELFLTVQHSVLTGQGRSIESEGGTHQWIEGRGDDLFVFKSTLGWGGSAVVDHVIGRWSRDHFARKKFLRSSDDNDKSRRTQFINELQQMKRLSHRHVVKLVGSYSDKNSLAILMRPVADEHLGQYLGRASDSGMKRQREIRLRCLFGCIATALEYLHSENVRHQDLKPNNILLKDDQVYLTDFGTSRFWAAEQTETTEKTLAGFTPRYAAPEVCGYTKRDPVRIAIRDASGRRVRDMSPDIWSLGCVFLEMCTVLAGWTINDLKGFFTCHGSEFPHYYNNQEAMAEWLDLLSAQFASLGQDLDNRFFLIVRAMLKEEPSERLRIKEVVEKIFVQKTIPYYGPCCDPRAGSSDWQDTAKDRSKQLTSAQLGIRSLSVSYKSPTVEDTNETILMSATRGPPTPQDCDLPAINDDQRAPASPIGIDVTAIHREKTCSPEPRSPLPGPSEWAAKLQSRLESLQHLGGLQCPWPGCKGPPGVALLLFDSIRSLRAHLRNEHDTHDLYWTYFFDPELTAGRTTLTPQTGAVVVTTTDHAEQGPQRFIELPEQHRPKTTAPRAMPRREPRHQTYEINAEPLDIPELQDAPFDLKKEVPGVPPISPAPSYVLASKNRFTREEILTSMKKSSPPLFVYGTMIFPAVFSAVARKYKRTADNDDGFYSKKAQRRIHTGPADWNGAGEALQNAAECMTPAVLSNSMRFKLPDTELAYVPPSWATAVTPKGFSDVMMGDVQGYLILGLSDDALGCLDDFHEQHAHIYFHDNGQELKPRENEYFQRSLVPVRVNTADGALMYVEAYAFLGTGEPVKELSKLMSSNTSLRPHSGQRRRSRSRGTPRLEHYDSELDDHDPGPEISDSKSRKPPWLWSPSMFLVSSSFNDAAVGRYLGQSSYASWMEEEQVIAKTIGTRLFLPGDLLAQAALERNAAALKSSLKTIEVNSPSALYGTALHAAAIKGNNRHMEILLHSGANPNTQAGEYGTSLIAAVVHGHATTVKMLLDYKADVFVRGGRYIGALYQAVNFDYLDIAHTLLERGAWLTNDYPEICDLATERGIPDMLEELQRYDMHRPSRQSTRASRRQLRDGDNDDRRRSRYSSRSESRLRQGSPGSSVSKPSTNDAVMALGNTVFTLYGQEGKWTGIKGVQLIRVAIEHGMSESMIEVLRPLIVEWPGVQKFMKRAVHLVQTRQLHDRSASEN